MGAATEERVTRRTNWLVTGARVGRTKIEAAAKVGCTVLSEEEYRDEIERRVLEGAKSSPQTSLPAERAKDFENPEWVGKLKNGRSIAF